MSKDEIKERYEESLGRPARALPEDHPDRWQWDYLGSREEREELLDRLSGNDHVELDDDEYEQEELF